MGCGSLSLISRSPCPKMCKNYAFSLAPLTHWGSMGRQGRLLGSGVARFPLGGAFISLPPGNLANCSPGRPFLALGLRLSQSRCWPPSLCWYWQSPLAWRCSVYGAVQMNCKDIPHILWNTFLAWFAVLWHHKSAEHVITHFMAWLTHELHHNCNVCQEARFYQAWYFQIWKQGNMSCLSESGTTSGPLSTILITHIHESWVHTGASTENSC